MIKKIAAIAGTGALLLASVVPALARDRGDHHTSTPTSTTTNTSYICSETITKATTGGNTFSSKATVDSAAPQIGDRHHHDSQSNDSGTSSAGGMIWTDNATADAVSVNAANLALGGRQTDRNSQTTNNRSMINSETVTVATSGDNSFRSRAVTDGSGTATANGEINTGAATASSVSVNAANVSVSGL